MNVGVKNQLLKDKAKKKQTKKNSDSPASYN